MQVDTGLQGKIEKMVVALEIRRCGDYVAIIF